MKQYFEDLLELGKPIWFDETGHPRFCKFKPKRVHNTDACEVALVKMYCECCLAEFKVAVTCDVPSNDVLLSDIIKSGKSPFSGELPNIRCCKWDGKSPIQVKVIRFYKLKKYHIIRSKLVFKRKRKYEVILTPDGEVVKDGV